MKKATLVLGAVFLSGCASTASFQGSGHTKLMVNDQPVESGSQLKLKDTSFGQHQFKVQKEESGEVMYGILPLKFHGGRLAADILFFAPAALFNLRGAYPEYLFDVDTGIVKFREQPNADWRFYKPTTQESDRAEAYYKGLEQKGS